MADAWSLPSTQPTPTPAKPLRYNMKELNQRGGQEQAHAAARAAGPRAEEGGREGGRGV